MLRHPTFSGSSQLTLRAPAAATERTSSRPARYARHAIRCPLIIFGDPAPNCRQIIPRLGREVNVQGRSRAISCLSGSARPILRLRRSALDLFALPRSWSRSIAPACSANLSSGSIRVLLTKECFLLRRLQGGHSKPNGCPTFSRAAIFSVSSLNL